jgi:hypothetical protein
VDLSIPSPVAGLVNVLVQIPKSTGLWKESRTRGNNIQLDRYRVLDTRNKEKNSEKTGVGDGLMAPGCAPCPSERRVGLPRIRRPWERMRSAQLHVPSSPSFPATNERTARLHFRSAQVRPSKTRTCFASESSAAISPRHSCTPPLSYPWMIQPKTIEAKKTG